MTQSGVRVCESIWRIVYKPGAEQSCSLAVGNTMSLLITSDMQMTSPLWQKVKRQKSLDESESGE